MANLGPHLCTREIFRCLGTRSFCFFVKNFLTDKENKVQIFSCRC